MGTIAMPPAPQSAKDLEPHLRQCGYGDHQLAIPFKFDAVEVPIVAFAGKPWDAWSACIGVVDTDGNSRAAAGELWTLGVPTVFVCRREGVDWWAMGPDGPKPDPRPIAWSEIGHALGKERESLSPSRIYASKLRKPGASTRQLWFFDVGLMPAVERKRGEVLTGLVEDVIRGLRERLGTRLHSRQAQEDVYRTVFWLLAAKILHDKHVPNFKQIELRDVDQVFQRIGRHHGETERFPPFGKTGRRAIDAAAARIATCGSLADVSSESLAHVYENALIDKTAESRKRKKASERYDIRKELGIHSTPSVLIHHILAQLWPLIEEIEVEDRHVFEPACGHAPFLTAAMRWLREWGSGDAPDDSHRYLRTHLHGLEADPFAVELARLALTLADEPHGNRWDVTPGDMFETNVLANHAGKARILLANPPYERFTDGQRKHYKRRGADITAQTKAVEMLERTLPVLAPGSVFGVVMPVGVLHDSESRALRRRLLDDCELAEIDVFADNLFEHSDHEAAVLLGRRCAGGVRRETLVYRRVREHGMAAFKDRFVFSSHHQVPLARFAESADAALRLPDLPEVWDLLSGNHTIESIADVGQGFSFARAGLIERARAAGGRKTSDAVPAFLDGVRSLCICQTPSEVWLRPARTPVKPWRSGNHTGRPQILVNYSPIMRGPWRIKALLDERGHAVTNSYATVRPHADGPPGRFLWAVLNSPVANAHVYSHAMKRHIYDSLIAAMPLPSRWQDAVSEIVQTANRYVALVREPDRFSLRGDDDGAVRHALLQMDAAVLRAYDLPPRLERQLLDLFTGVERKGVGCEFRGYYPPGLDAYVPLHELISEEYARSTLGRLREAPRTGSPTVLAALRGASEPAPESEERRRRYARLSALLDEWAAEEGDFDARIGTLIEQSLKESTPRHFRED
jgi:hypothetical protein